MATGNTFIHGGRHFGKLGERSAASYGTIELYDIGEADTVGAVYADGSRQVQPITWHPGIRDALGKSLSAKNRLLQALSDAPRRPRFGNAPTEDLATALRRVSTKEWSWSMSKQPATAPASVPVTSNATPVAVAAPVEAPKRGRRAKADKASAVPDVAPVAPAPKRTRAPRVKDEAVDIPKGAEKELGKLLKAVGPVNAIRKYVAANPKVNRTSVVELAVKVGINKSTAGVQYGFTKRFPDKVKQ